MDAPAIAVPADRRARVAPVWIIGRTSDLTCLIGGVLVAYGLLGAHLFLGVAAVTIYMAWVLTIDGPHVFATLSRTYLDPEERAARAGMLRSSLGFFALGPAAVALSALAGRRLPYDLFLTVCTLWAYWHVVRQHYGVMVLYEKKAGDTDVIDERVDRIFLYVGLLAPVVGFAAHHPRTLAMVGVDAPPSWAPAVALAAWSLLAGASLALVGRQLVRRKGGRPVHGTKLLFLGAATSLSVVLFSPAIAGQVAYEAIVPIVTSFHNIQYLAIVWFFHRLMREIPVWITRYPDTGLLGAASFAATLAAD